MQKKREQLNPIVEKRAAELEDLCRRFEVARLDLFGPAATGHFREGESDLDFLVEFLPMPTANFADNYFGLLENLEELFGRPVDLVFGRAIRNPYFLQSVEETKTLVYAT